MTEANRWTIYNATRNRQRGDQPSATPDQVGAER
jgi:hypothetical protein